MTHPDNRKEARAEPVPAPATTRRTDPLRDATDAPDPARPAGGTAHTHGAQGTIHDPNSVTTGTEVEPEPGPTHRDGTPRR